MHTDHNTNGNFPATKVCSKCGQEKPTTEYYRDKRQSDGLYSHCKACHYRMTSAYAQTSRGKAVIAKSKSEGYWERGGKEKDRMRNAQESYREMRRSYAQSEAGRAAARRKEERRKRESPEKIKAKTAVMHAVQRGELARASTQTCANCGKQASEYHHHSYEPEFWLDVIPLCKICHAKTYTTPYK